MRVACIVQIYIAAVPVFWDPPSCGAERPSIRRNAGFTTIDRNIMELEIMIHSDLKYIEIVTKGVLDKDTSIDMAKKIAETMRHNRITKALIDHRNAINKSGTVMDVYERPKIFRIVGMILGVRIAEVINPDQSGHFKFSETVCLNQGYRFLVFYDRKKALEWLLA